VQKALKVADIKDRDAKKKYSDFTGAYMRQLLIVKRNNSVAALKKKVVNEIQSKCRGTFHCNVRQNTNNALVAQEFRLPEKFNDWGAAVKAVMDARAANVSPYDVDKDVWRIFEIMAFELVPRMNG
jgi:hypothetical protein